MNVPGVPTAVDINESKRMSESSLMDRNSTRESVPAYFCSDDNSVEDDSRGTAIFVGDEAPRVSMAVDKPNLIPISETSDQDIVDDKTATPFVATESAASVVQQYRPSDYGGMESASRDSLMPNRQTNMDDVLADIDDSYRVSNKTMAEAVAEYSPLLRAAKEGRLNEIKDLLNRTDTDILRRDPVHGQTALHIGIKNGHMDIVQALCESSIAQAIMDVPDNRRNTALHLAAAKSRRITKYLLEKGSKVDVYNMRNQTPLGVHLLTTKKDDPILTEMLLQHKADPNACVDQATLIHVAVDRSLIEIACRLVRHGARMDVKDDSGKLLFDKVNRKILRKLFCKITYPPVWVPNENRDGCMLCTKKFGKLAIGVRRHHCRHCGRLCCGECAHLSVESVRFPKAFENRLRPGAKADTSHKRVCKTCYSIFKERKIAENAEKNTGGFYDRVVNIRWDEVDGQHNTPAQGRA